MWYMFNFRKGLEIGVGTCVWRATSENAQVSVGNLGWLTCLLTGPVLSLLWIDVPTPDWCDFKQYPIIFNLLNLKNKIEAGKES